MIIKPKLEVDCPSGFYCMKNANKLCIRLQFKNNRPYCEVFYPFLETSRRGDVLKCEKCLLAEWEARKEK